MAEALFSDVSTKAIACPDCDLVQRIPSSSQGQDIACSRCGAFFFRHREKGLDACLSLTVAVAFLFWLASTEKFLSLSLDGRSQSAMLLSGVVELAGAGAVALAALVFLTIFAVPIFRIGGYLYVLVPLRLGVVAPGTGPIFRWVERLREWTMLDVLLIAVIVAGVKMGEGADVEIGNGLIAFVAMVLIWTLSREYLDSALVWNAVAPQDAEPDEEAVACNDCGNRVASRPGESLGRCPRCRAPLEDRKFKAFGRTMAFVLAGAVLYVPANTLPILILTNFGKTEPQTLLGSIDLLFSAGMWPIAVILFFASILVPMLKLVGLSWLVWAARRGSRRPLDETRLFRVIAYVGRWSMVDVLVLALLVALVRLGNVASISPGIGATCFAAVVVLTLFAAQSFDPRLIWDRERTS